MDDGKLAYSVAEFCKACGISRSFFYQLREEKRGPKVTKIGDRTLITKADAEEWLKDQQHA